ncbi:MAG: type II toxin-antitoxin system RelE/ParE family toxin [Syntrophaceae bacterium]|nr:type II toxin-antitoxin system RelE/ParE family toxin [Syntrophaceae bacterium]
MARTRTITFAESALKDLEVIRDWYIDQGAPDAREKLLGEIIAQVEWLVDFPESGRIVPECEIANLGEIIFQPFRIVYRLDKNRARIVRIWKS